MLRDFLSPGLNGQWSATPAFAKAVNDAIARDAEQPCPRLLNGFGKPIGLDQFLQNIL